MKTAASLSASVPFAISWRRITADHQWQRALAMALHVPYSRLSEITKGERGVSADTALRLERYFGSEAKGWLNLQAAYELRVAEIENGKAIAKAIQPLWPAA
jgi:addiction module HigA family antidote